MMMMISVPIGQRSRSLQGLRTGERSWVNSLWSAWQCLYTSLTCVHVVRADQHGRDPAQLSDARPVPAVRRRDLLDGPLSPAGRLRPPHLRLLRRRDVRQDRGDGFRRQEGLLRRNVEPTRHVHRHRRVGPISITALLSLWQSIISSHLCDWQSTTHVYYRRLKLCWLIFAYRIFNF